MSVYQFGQLLFWVAFLASVFLPLRFALVTYVVMCNIDMPGLGNMIKILLVPMIFLFRIRRASPKEDRYAIRRPIIEIPYLIWGLFVVYAALAIGWSQLGNTTAGIKFVANLVGILLYYLVFKRASNHGLLNTRFLTSAIISTIILGVIQTYVLDSTYGSEYSRFTGFIASQPYAAFLVGLFTLVIWNNQYKLSAKLILTLTLLTALVLNGSRTWFIGTCIVLAIFGLTKMFASLLHMSLIFFSLFIVVAGGLLFYNYAMQNQERLENSNRLFQGFYTLVGQESNSGTIGFRENMNDAMIYEIKHSTQPGLFFGHGTSSSEYVARKYESYQFHGENVDGNRVAHNEWLRITYEFGIVGMILWLLFLLSCFFYLASKGYQIVPLLAYGGGMVVALTTENVIMSAGTIGIGALMILLATKQKKPMRAEAEISAPLITQAYVKATTN